MAEARKPAAKSKTKASAKRATSKSPARPKKSPAGRSKQSALTLTSFNPRTGREIGKVPVSSPADVADSVAAARKVASEWAAIPAEGRVRFLREVRVRIYDRMDDIIETVSAECGKPRAEALAHDVLPAVLTLLYYERTAVRALRPERVGSLVSPLLGVATRVDWRPFGVVGCITPWNYPFFLSFMAIAPALFAGNSVVLKPSEITPGVGERVREVLEPLPPGVVSVVQGGGEVGAALVDAPCDKLCFIGSPATGRKIAAAAAEHLTPVVMELGGQDAAIVCDDADLDIASSGVLWGSFFNAGQTCASIERVFVSDSIAVDFTDRLLDKLTKVRQGAGDEDVGSLTCDFQLDVVKRHVSDAVSKGARVLAGGPDAPPTGGDGTLFYAPTVIEGVGADMDVIKEETFGPVLPIIRVQDEEEAVRRSNEEGINLTASVWTRNRKKGEAIASQLKAGSVTINTHGDTGAAPWTPWGGVGESGYGRLNGKLGLREFVVPVTVARNLTPSMKKPYWYPYDEATTRVLRAAANLLSAPGITEKARHVPALLGNLSRAIKAKI
jgi:acyl-CoA reductase-like NAD-dependent aldehyde dehydrogenase